MPTTLLTFPALPLPDLPEGVSTDYRTEETQFGDGYKIVAPDGINTRQDTIELSWTNISQTEFNAVKSFVEVHAPATPFLYTPVDGAQRVFICRRWDYKRVDVGFYNMQVSLERIYGF